MAIDHARIARSFNALAVALEGAAADAKVCAALSAALADCPAAAAGVTCHPPTTVIAGLTAAIDAWCDDYARAIDTAQPQPGSIPGN